PVHSIHGSTARSWDRLLGWKRRRQLRQRARRVGNWAVQVRGDLASRSLAECGGRGLRDVGMGGVVQLGAVPRTAGAHPTGGVRSVVSSGTDGAARGGSTHINESSINPVRFSVRLGSLSILHEGRYGTPS